MKHKFIKGLVLIIAILFSGCDIPLGLDENQDEPEFSSSEIPGDVLSFIQENYPGYRIEEFEKEDLCNDEYYYEVELEDGPGEDKELYFSLQWEFLFELVEISTDDLPSAVTNTIERDYPNHEIEKDDIYRLIWNDDTIQYLVELEGGPGSDSDPEIIFDADGSIDCIDD